jgi:enoyl-CoA hydratase/carnithine racemase
VHADDGIRAIVITGAGRAFSAGRDLRETAEREAAGLPRDPDPAESDYDVFALRRALSRSPKPWVAAVNGPAMGGGIERALDADIRIASTAARFATPEVSRGIVASYAVNHLATMLPLGEALHMLLTGAVIDAHEAHRIGLVHEVVEPEALLPRAIEIAETIASHAPLAVQATKRIAMHARLKAIDEQSDFSVNLMRQVTDSEDAREGASAFAEKRLPNWLGR